jgi:hypothetical protein
MYLSESSRQENAMNCECNGPIHLVMGVERCQVCEKLAGGDAFVPFGDPLPTRSDLRGKTKAVSA